jgi:chromosome segregation ATPase
LLRHIPPIKVRVSAIPMFLQRLAVLIGGFAAGALVRRWQAHDAVAPQRSLDRLSREWKAQVRAHDYRLRRLEERSEAHEARLQEAPSTAQIVSAMDELLAKAMTGLDGRLTAQAQSIETLQATVSQTDELLERVLESLETLRETPSDGRT